MYTEGYGDDICLLVVGKFPNMILGLIQWALHTVEMWCEEVGLLVNPDKTGLVVFTRKRKFCCFFEPYFFGVTLHCTVSVKYLGVVLGSWQAWREHVDVKVRKAHSLLWACVVMWGPATQGGLLAVRLYY